MTTTKATTSSHALLSVFAANGIDRVFLVPGESYLGILDALSDFPDIDVVTCRHEGGAGFMACADGRLTRRPGVVMVSRGPGATNASIAVHTAQQDAVPLILVIGQIPKADLRKEAFQEIAYQEMYGSIAKWVVEVTDPAMLAEAAFKAIRIATSGTPGPVVLVVPEDIQHQEAAQPTWRAVPHDATAPSAETVGKVAALLNGARQPLIIAGGALDSVGGRRALKELAERCHVPVAVSFRQHDIFPNEHLLFAGDLGLVNPKDQIATFESSDLIIALGTRFGDITSQGYTFPKLPAPSQTLVHVYADPHIVGLHFAPTVGLVCDPAQFAALLAEQVSTAVSDERKAWAKRLNDIYKCISAWPDPEVSDGIPFVKVVQSLSRMAPADTVICLDAGTFAAPVYRHFPFSFPQRLMAPLSGAMGYGTPSAVASQLRLKGATVVCMVGDGGFLMTGNEMIAAVERKLPILFILANNNCYGSIRVHQELTYKDRHLGTTLSNPDFVSLARSFGVEAERVEVLEEVDAAIERGLAAKGPYLIEVHASLAAILPVRGAAAPALERSGN
ncbi:thiamine pyrophosphate-binding protein [Cupriavidus taiwanensis]|uniref:thiamine pyrophosphate-dependent enzyme n=1 Tax=Cupriavidus taiwanensis TaxID=164546 RepID=UPI00254201AD|nr:thiamine pyrophosphate-dependent enzyme [Cupriavidus taiwanensis]MDK3022653.1 thiamine pyrophosphate-binding protein [Cupriavidus taiwanensis]